MVAQKNMEGMQGKRNHEKGLTKTLKIFKINGRMDTAVTEIAIVNAVGI